MNANGSGVTRLTTETATDYQPDWQPVLRAVGGLAELPDVSGSSSPPYAAIARGLAAAALAITAGGWYARRRLLR
jgi:hypothetical protein